MKNKYILIMSLALMFTISSCTKEDIQPEILDTSKVLPPSPSSDKKVALYGFNSNDTYRFGPADYSDTNIMTFCNGPFNGQDNPYPRGFMGIATRAANIRVVKNLESEYGTNYTISNIEQYQTDFPNDVVGSGSPFYLGTSSFGDQLYNQTNCDSYQDYNTKLDHVISYGNSIAPPGKRVIGIEYLSHWNYEITSSYFHYYMLVGYKFGTVTGDYCCGGLGG